MAKTRPRSLQIRDGEIRRPDLNTTEPGDAVITKVIAGTNVTITSTGADPGTGDVTINASGSGGVPNIEGGTPSTIYLADQCFSGGDVNGN